MAMRARERENSKHRLDFIELSERLATFAARDGLKLTPYEDSELPHFSLLTPAEKDRVLASLESDCGLCAHLQSQGFQVHDARALTWKMVRFLGISPMSDALGLIEKEDMVAIYNSQNTLLFASLNFFDEVSYSLEDLYCRPWMELFWRAAEPAAALVEYAAKILIGEVRETIPVNVAPHYVEETKENGRAWVLRNKYISPIFEKNAVVGFLCINGPLKRVDRLKK